MTLPLQTGSAIIGARVLSTDAATAAGERDAVVALANELAEELGARAFGARRRARQHRRPRRRTRWSRNPPRRPAARRSSGGELMSTADWAPQDNVDGVHLTDAASG